MANLPKNTTVDNKIAIVESQKNNHTHSLSQIRGISEDILTGGIYAEKIDGITYSMMLDRFVTDDNNVLEGTLNITSPSSHPKGIVNKSEVDDLLLANNIKNYDLSSLPSLSVVSAPDSIIITNETSSIDQSWLPGFTGSTSDNISFVGDTNISSDNTYTYEITNFNSFSSYSASVTEGQILLDDETGIITYNSPLTAPTEKSVDLTIVKDGNIQKDIAITIQSDPDMLLYYYDGTSYIPITGTIEIPETVNQLVRIETYNPNYNYSISSNIVGISPTQTDDIITVTPPLGITQDTSGTLTVSRTGSTETVDILIRKAPDISLSYYNGTSYVPMPNPISINSEDPVTLRIDTYDPVFTYTINSTSTKLSLSRNNNIITMTPAGSNSTYSMENVTLSREGDSLSFDVEMNLYNNIYQSWAFTTYDPGTEVISENNYHIIDDSGYYVTVGAIGGDITGALIKKYDVDLNIMIRKCLKSTVTEDRIYYIDGCQSHDGGYIACGQVGPSAFTDHKALIVKYDSNLNVVAQKTLWSGYDDQFNSVFKSHDGGYIALGSHSTLYTDTAASGLVAKYDNNLNLITQTGITSPRSTHLYGGVPTDDGGYIIVGSHTDQYDSFIHKGLILKYDANLNFISQKLLRAIDDYNIQSIIKTNDGNYMICGRIRDGSSVEIRNSHLLKIDANLNIIDQKTFNVSGNNTSDKMNSVVQNDQGNFVGVGYFYDTLDNPHAYIIEISEDLNNVLKAHELARNNYDSLYFMSFENIVYSQSDGGYATAGLPYIAKLPNDLSNLTGTFTNHDYSWGVINVNIPTHTVYEDTKSLTSSALTLTDDTPTKLVEEILPLSQLRSEKP